MEEYIMGTNLPDSFATGQILEATDLNKMNDARTNDVVPIDNTTRNNTDQAGALGSATYRYTEAHIDNVKIDGSTVVSADGNGLVIDTNYQHGIMLGAISAVTAQSEGNNLIACRFTALASCTITTLGIYFGGITNGAKVKLAIYSDSSSLPNTLLGQTAEITLATENNYDVVVGDLISNVNIVKGTKYWIAYLVDTVMSVYAINSSTADPKIGVYYAQTYATGFPATFPAITGNHLASSLLGISGKGA
jgi:hypothetical protein